MRRLIQREIEDPLSMLIITGKAGKGNQIRVETRKGKLFVRTISQKVPALPAGTDDPDTPSGVSDCEPSEACSKR